MGKRLKDKVAVVTGGGSGIGRCVSLDLAAEGALVVVNDLGVWTPDKPAGKQSADLVVDEIKKAGGKAHPNYDSVVTMAGGKNVIDTAINVFSKIDILVCCAGCYAGNTIDATPEEEWDRIIATNLKGHFTCIKPAAALMKKQKSGRIITFSSRASFGMGTGPAYSAAKAGVLGLTRALASELGKYGITANSILPSAVTPLFPGKKVAFGDGLPAANPPGPEMVAPFVVYLATDEARKINGQFFYAGGGDLAIYSQPWPSQVLHKAAKWTLDEISELFPRTLGLNLVSPEYAEYKLHDT